MTINLERWGKTNAVFERFGGGWKYKIGLQFGGRTLIVSLLFGQIRITRAQKEPEEK